MADIPNATGTPQGEQDDSRLYTRPETTGLIIAPPDREAVLRQALARHTAHIPSTKGMAPAERAQRLHAELERRIQAAREALANV